jgi:hypothetical protein
LFDHNSTRNVSKYNEDIRMSSYTAWWDHWKRVMRVDHVIDIGHFLGSPVPAVYRGCLAYHQGVAALLAFIASVLALESGCIISRRRCH